MRRTLLTAAVVLTSALGACQAEPDDAAREPGTPAQSVGPGGMMGGNMTDMRRRMMGGSGNAPETEAAVASAADCPDVDQALVDRGREVFNGAGGCTACHGSDATGTTLAPDLTDERLNVDGSYGELAGLIRTGVAQPKQYPAPMPPKGGASLSDAQVCAVAAYVLATRPSRSGVRSSETRSWPLRSSTGSCSTATSSRSRTVEKVVRRVPGVAAVYVNGGVG